MQHRFGVAHHLFKHRVAGIGVDNLNHLDLVKLVLANQATCVASGAACLGAKTRRVRRELDGELGLGHHFVAHKIGQRHLTGGNQVQRGVVGCSLAVLSALFGGKQVALKLGQLTGAAQALGVHHVRRVALGVAMLLGLNVQHERRQSAVQAGNRAFHDGEA